MWKLVVGAVVGCVILLVIGCIIAVALCRQRAKAQENTLKLTARMSGLEESEVCTNS